MSTELPLTSDELNCLQSLLPYANEPQLNRIQFLLTGRPTVRFPLIPTPRQTEFLNLDCDEALYGGAAGGGKSEALLMWLAEGVHIPEYTGLIFRRTYPQLTKSNDGLIAKSRRLYSSLGGKWHDSKHQWRFPSGAMIEMGHLTHEKTVEDYQGPSYHRIAFDELTQFSESQYTYLFSRKRRTVGFPINMGIRAASNPGGEGHQWVRRRFVTKESEEAIRSWDKHQPSPAGSVFFVNERRAFVPARLADNPFLDRAEYSASLAELPPVLRRRLEEGDWSTFEGSIVKPDWLRYWSAWSPTTDYYDLLSPSGDTQLRVRWQDCQRAITCDTAQTSEDVARQKKGKAPSYSVISVWDYHRESGSLIWRDCRRGLWDFPDLLKQLRLAYAEHKPDWMGIENKSSGAQALDMLRDLSVRRLEPGGRGKLERFGRAANLLEQGRVFIAKDRSWREAVEAVLLAWDGDSDTPFDEGDTLAYAALEIVENPSEPEYEIDSLIAGGIESRGWNLGGWAGGRF